MADRDDIARKLTTPLGNDEEGHSGDGNTTDGNTTDGNTTDGNTTGHDDAEHGAGPDIVRLHLTRAWRSFAPSPDLDARVRARLTGSTAATMGALGLGAATGAGRPSPWASLQASGKVGVLVGAGLLGLGFLSGYVAHSSSGPNAGAQPRAVVTSAVESGRSPSVAPPTVEGGSPGVVAPRRASEGAREPRDEQREASRSRERAPQAALPQAPPSRAATPQPAAPQPGEELALLRRAERAVRADDAALALALIDELEARYPRSTLLEERSAIELLAHCRAGATDARARADRFLRQHPQSLYAGRARELCSGSSASDER